MIPLPVFKKRPRYQARFFRSDSLGGEPIKNAKDQPMPSRVLPVEGDADGGKSRNRRRPDDKTTCKCEARILS